MDCDAAVNALGDIRAGCDIDESSYLNQRKKRRTDLSVLVLVDVGVSRAEMVKDAELVKLVLFPTLSPHQLRPPRILEIEVISSLLCTSTLNPVWDSFRIWSSSDTGREQVVLSEIERFNGPISGVLAARTAGMKPVHATRLGAAIRHCGMVLSKLQTETKLLRILTDGRPFEIDYRKSLGEEESQQYAQQYACADSDKASYEPTERGIEPYVGTFDPSTVECISELKSVKVEVSNMRARLYMGLLDGNAAVVGGNHRYGPNEVISQTSGGITR